MVILTLLVICFFIQRLLHTTVYGAASTWQAPIPLFHKSPSFNAWIDAASILGTVPDLNPEYYTPQVLPQLDVIQTSHDTVVLRMGGQNSSRQYFLRYTRAVSKKLHWWHYCFHIFYAHTDPLHNRRRSSFGQFNIPQSGRGAYICLPDADFL